jgi:Uma2 family endonuclease
MWSGDIMRNVRPKGTATVEDLLNMPEDGMKHELVNGEIVVSPTGWKHSKIATRIIHILATFLDEHPIGELGSPDLGIWLSGGNLRSPDVTFIRNEKVPEGEKQKAFLEAVPDLAVEVLSPSDRPKFVAEKIREFLENGVLIVWLVDPAQKTVTEYRSISEIKQYSGDDVIQAEPVLPGFSCSISRFF